MEPVTASNIVLWQKTRGKYEKSQNMEVREVTSIQPQWTFHIVLKQQLLSGIYLHVACHFTHVLDKNNTSARAITIQIPTGDFTDIITV